MSAIYFAALIAVPELPVPASFSDAETMRCFIVTTEISASGHPGLEGPGTMAALFFLGRLDRALDRAAFEALFRTEASGLQSGDKPALQEECLNHVALKATELMALTDPTANPSPSDE